MKKLTPANIILVLTLILGTLQNSGLVPTASSPEPTATPAPCPKASVVELDAGK